MICNCLTFCEKISKRLSPCLMSVATVFVTAFYVIRSVVLAKLPIARSSKQNIESVTCRHNSLYVTLVYLKIASALNRNE